MLHETSTEILLASMMEPSDVQLQLTWHTSHESSGRVTAPDLWYEDGDVVLVADNTQYKVWANLLARHSTRFKTMFLETLTAYESSELYLGCPLYTLPHRSDEVTLMLRRMLGFDRCVLSCVCS